MDSRGTQPYIYMYLFSPNLPKNYILKDTFTGDIAFCQEMLFMEPSLIV